MDSFCLFCQPGNHVLVAEGKTVYAIKDANPVSDNHLLIIPFRHCKDYFELTPEEHREIQEFIHSLAQGIRARDPLVTGFNIGVNCGASAGQTIFHTHIHLIPRKDNDTPRPRGGVRGVIPDRMNY